MLPNKFLSDLRRDGEVVGTSTSDITAVAKLPITPDELSEIDALMARHHSIP